MGKAIFFSVPAYGDTNPLLATIKELVVRGEHVIYYGTKEFKELVEETGAEYRIYKGNINNINFVLAENDMLGFFKSMLKFGFDKLKYNLEDVKQDKPDYILHGSMSFWGKYLGKILGIRTINLLHSAPMGKNDIKPSLNMLLTFVFPLLYYIISSKFNKNSQPYKFREEFNITPDFFDLTTNKEDLNLIYSSEIVSPELAKSESGYKFIGPSLYFKEDKEDDFPYEVISEYKNIKPLIYISLGTIHSNNPEFYRLCFDALGDKKFQVILSIGRELKISDFMNVPDNFLIRNSNPQQTILKDMDLFITHGGMNSVNEALCFGTPMIVLPHHMEQATSANRVARLGCGLTMEIDKMRSKDLYDNVTEILNNNSFKKSCMFYSKIIGKEEESSYLKAADFIMNHKIN
ncbi:MAG: hypothetical protein OCD02_18745 [Spirochaetaceae bacterium]